MSSSPALAIPKGSLVLVTGATGFIGSAITSEFIKQGYRVRAAVRTQEKFDNLAAALEKKYGPGDHVEATFVPDFTIPNAYKDAVKDVAAIVHVATETSLSPDPDKVVKETVAAMKSLIDTAKSSPSIKRVVLTSSIAALTPRKADSGETWDPADWNDWAIENMYSLKEAMVTYSASKTLGEREFWAGDVPYERNSVLPGMVYGAALDVPFRTSSYAWLRGVWDNDPQNVYIMKNYTPQGWWVNVEDVARLHVGATVFESVKNQRLLAMADKQDIDEVIDFFHKVDPQRTLTEKLGNLSEDTTKANVAESVKVLGLFGQDTWVGQEETLRANIA